MKVKATALGYYGDIRRKEGDEFVLVTRTVGDKDHRRTLTAEQQFSATWMERLDGPAPTKQQAAPTPEPIQDAPPAHPRAMDRPVIEPAKSVKGHTKRK